MDTENLRKHAEEIIEYFDSSVQDCVQNGYNVEVWQKGLNTAQEWLRLINSENTTQSELQAFIGVVHANRYSSSMWSSFAEKAYDWVSSKGVSVPPHDVFFKSDGLRSYDLKAMFNVPSVEHAQKLIEIYQLYSQEDSTSEVWRDGLKIAQEWLRLINSHVIADTEISELMKRSFDNLSKHQGTSLSLDGFFAMSYWCGSIGKANLVPNGFGALFQYGSSGE